MPVILRVDVDRAYWKGIYNYPRMIYGLFPAIDPLGYLEPCKNLLEDLNSRGVKASFFFQIMTLPKREMAKKILRAGHSVGLHAVETQSFDRFSRELSKISERFEGKIRGFTKHGSGKFKLSRRHDPTYDPQKFVKYAKEANLKYFLGNGENPEEIERVVEDILFFPSAFWLNRNYREDRFTVDWLIDESVNRNIVVLMHPVDVIRGTKLMIREYEKILDGVEIIKPIGEIL